MAIPMCLAVNQSNYDMQTMDVRKIFTFELLSQIAATEIRSILGGSHADVFQWGVSGIQTYEKLGNP